MARLLTAIFVLTALSSWSLAQAPNLQPGAKEPDLPIVTFDFALPGGVPPHYAIAVQPDGRATYRSDEVPAAGPNASLSSASLEPYEAQFLVSEPTRARIFQLTLALRCFQGQFEYRGGRVANMGAKTLKCTYADRETVTEFNYTANPQLQQLTNIFQNISNTMEFGRRLTYLHRFDKLGLEAELKLMEDAAKSNRLAELQATAPQLESILNDSGVMNVSRRRAEHLLQMVKANPAARAATPQ